MAATCALATALVVAFAPERAPATHASRPPEERVRDCSRVSAVPKRDVCYERVALRLLDREGGAGIDHLEAIAKRDKRLGERCHLVMHSASAKFAHKVDVTAKTLASYLPRSSSVNCPAGFTHGLMIYALEDVDPADASGILPACTREPSRILQINCIHGLGHAFMRLQDTD
jgi:hypothetical protein